MTSQLSLLSIGYSQIALGPVEIGPTARPWEPFKKIPIRLFGTNKTTKNHKLSACSLNWVADVLYERDAWWVDCQQCAV